MVDLWADDKILTCLSIKGDLDIIQLKGKNSRVTSSKDLSEFLFPQKSRFLKDRREAMAITGCAVCLAVATYDKASATSTIILVSLRGKVQGSATDNGKSKSASGPNPVHKMSFCTCQKRFYIVAQDLFTHISLYLVNRKRAAELHYLRTVTIKNEDVNWSLVSLPASTGQLISVNNIGHHRLLTIKIDR